MLNFRAREAISSAVGPIGSWFLRRGITPDVMTVVGTVATITASLTLFPTGHLLAGAVVCTVFVLFDLLDGAIARARGYGTPFGAVLDATCDRIADGALFGALAWWCLGTGDNRALAVAALVCLVVGQVISYIKARAETVGLRAEGGWVERAERWIIALVGAGLQGLGVPYAINVALWALAGLSVITLGQRFVAVYRSAQAAAQPGATAGSPAGPPDSGRA